MVNEETGLGSLIGGILKENNSKDFSSKFQNVAYFIDLLKNQIMGKITSDEFKTEISKYQLFNNSISSFMEIPTSDAVIFDNHTYLLVLDLINPKKTMNSFDSVNLIEGVIPLEKKCDLVGPFIPFNFNESFGNNVWLNELLRVEKCRVEQYFLAGNGLNLQLFNLSQSTPKEINLGQIYLNFSLSSTNLPQVSLHTKNYNPFNK